MKKLKLWIMTMLDFLWIKVFSFDRVFAVGIKSNKKVKIKVPFADLKAQYKTIKKDIDKAIRSIIKSTEFIGGNPVKKFEESFAKMQGIKYCAGCSSGTSALFLALKALGIGRGDEVITVPNTFIATAEAITECGASVRFCDIDDDTYTIDPLKLFNAITKKTKAVIVVHLYGRMAKMDLIRKIADDHNLFLIEDAAQAHLARYNDKPVGFYSHVACFSFYPGKNLGAYGDAGAVCSNYEKLIGKVRMLSNHGRVKKYEHLVEGYNHRMDALQASILSAKLPYLERWTQRRRAIARKYTENFIGMFKVPLYDRNYFSVYHLYVIRVLSENRDKLQDHLSKNGIQTGIHYPIPLHLQPAYGYLNLKKGSFPVSEHVSKEILSLPIYPEMTDRQVDFVIKKVREYFYKR